MNRKLSEYQNDFIINNFFILKGYAGSRTIAASLIVDGECVVAGKECIWGKSLIGYYIKTEEAAGFVDCLLYKFDLDKFLKSNAFITALSEETTKLCKEMHALNAEVEELKELTNIK